MDLFTGNGLEFSHSYMGYTLVTFMIIDFIKVKVYGLLEHEGIKF